MQDMLLLPPALLLLLQDPALLAMYTPLLLLGQLVLWWVLEDECVDLVAHVNITDEATGLALQEDAFLLDLHDSLWVATAVALHVLLDEGFKQFAELLGVVGSIDDGGAKVLVIVGLGTQLAAVELEDVCNAQTEGGFHAVEETNV